MNQIEKLNAVLKVWEQKATDVLKESDIARKHNYELEAISLYTQFQLIQKICMDIKLKVIDELIDI